MFALVIGLALAAADGGAPKLEAVPGTDGVRATVGGYTVTAARIEYDPRQRVLVAEGSASAPARLVTARGELSGARVVADLRTDTFRVFAK